MTKVGEKSVKPTKPAKSSTSKKEKSEDIREAVEWVVNDFAKDEEYFHKVIGLPNVGKIPKDITAQDVPLAELEKHFGVKAKNDKNGYKKEGVLGIPTEDIQKLVTALDGIEKFQFFSLEVARGLYYKRILKRAVHWAACGVDKHKGQLAWRLRRNAPAQADLPPWKRVEHTYTMPAGLELTVAEEEQEHYSPVKSMDKCETPDGGRKARKARKASDVAPAEGLSKNEGEPSNDSSAGKARNLRRASDVATAEAKSENESECPNEGRKAINVASEIETEQGTLAKSTPLLPCKPVQGPADQGTLAVSTSAPVLLSDAVQSPVEQEQSTHAASMSPLSLGQQVPDADRTGMSTSEETLNSDNENCQFPDIEDCQFPDNVGSEEVQTLETIATVVAPMVAVLKIIVVDSQVPIFDVPTPKQKGCNELPLVPGRRESYPESWL